MPIHAVATIPEQRIQEVSKPGRILAGLPRGMSLALALFAAVGCADAITAPPAIDRAVAERVLPSVTDARVRLAPRIENEGVRDRLVHDIRQIEVALVSLDALKARLHVQLAGKILADYRAGLGSVMKDGPDVTAIALMLHAVSRAVGGTFEIEQVP
jgi:hypothetical protein